MTKVKPKLEAQDDAYIVTAKISPPSTYFAERTIMSSRSLGALDTDWLRTPW